MSIRTALNPFTGKLTTQYDPTNNGSKIVLKAPNGTKFEVTVSNLGVVVVTPA